MPLELLTFIATFGARAIQSHWANKQELEANSHSYQMEQGELQLKGLAKAQAKVTNSLFGVTTSVLAISAFIAIIVWPKVAVFMPGDVAVSLAYTEGAHKTLLFGWAEKLKFRELDGVVITPLDYHIAMAIAGMYFGNMKRRFK